MNRRKMLGLMGAAGAAVPLALVPKKTEGFMWESTCHNGHKSSQWIDTGSTLKVGNQCPECLAVLDLGALGRKILGR